MVRVVATLTAPDLVIPRQLVLVRSGQAFEGRFEVVPAGVDRHFGVNAYDQNMDKYRKLRIGEDDSVGDNDLSVYSNKTRVLQENRRDVNAINRVESSRINGLFFGSGIEEKPFGVDSFASSNRFA